MRAYRPVVGISADTSVGIEKFAEAVIRALDAHFARHAFLLGGRPCCGDFALFAPLFAHLFRDPHSRFLFSSAPHCVRWLLELAGNPVAHGDFLPEDEANPYIKKQLKCLPRANRQ